MGQATLQTWEETTKRLPKTQNILCGGLFHSECVQNDTEIKLEIPTWKRFYSWNHTELFQINFEAQGQKKGFPTSTNYIFLLPGQFKTKGYLSVLR